MDSSNLEDDKVLAEVEKLVITKSMEDDDYEERFDNDGTIKTDVPEPEAVEKIVWHIQDEDDDNNEENSSAVQIDIEADDKSASEAKESSDTVKTSD